MEWSEKVTAALEGLLSFAQAKGLVDPLDRAFCRNLLLDVMGMDAPADVTPYETQIPETATSLLRCLCDAAVEKGLIEDMQTTRDLFSARLMG